MSKRCAANTSTAATTSCAPSTTSASTASSRVGAFYVFPNITSTGLTQPRIFARLAGEKKVAVRARPGLRPERRRLCARCYATSLEQIKIAMERIGEFVAECRTASKAA